MKKLTSILLTLVVLFGAFALSMKTVKADYPALGTISEDSPYFSAYMPENYGIERLDETTIGVLSKSGWGQRGGYKEKFDLTTLNLKFNVASLGDSGGVMVLMSSKAPQTYAGEATTEIVMDIVRNKANNHTYLVTFSHSSHNTSVEGFDGKTWHDSYKGLNLENVEDDIIDIKISVVEGVPHINVNGNDFAVPKAFDSVANTGAVNVSWGCFNESGERYITASVSDAASRAYYSETGVYGKAKKLIDAYTQALQADLTVAANVLAAKEIRDQIDLEGLKEFDKPRLVPLKQANDLALQAALDALNLEDLTPVYEGNPLTYRLDKAGALSFPINLMGLEVSKVKIGEAELASSLYQYQDGNLVIAADALKDLSVGAQELYVSTLGGTVKINLTVYSGAEFKPVLKTTSVEYTLGNTSSVKLEADLKGAALTEVKIGEIVVEGCKYKDGKITIPNKVLELLDEGDYVITVSTEEGSVEASLKVLPKPAIEDRVPELGNYGSDVDWFSRWQGALHGAVRTGVTEMKIITTAGWGQRGGFKTPFNIKDLSMSFDLSGFVNDTVLMVLFSTADNTYAGEGQTQLIIELVKVSDTSFFVVFGDRPTQSEHCSSFEAFTDGSTSDKPGYSGITIEAQNSIINITLKEDASKNVVINVNGEEYSIPNAYQNVSNAQATYISLGTFLGSGATPVQQYVVKHILDAERKAYYAEDGVFGKQNKLVNDLKEACKDLSTLAKIEAAIAIKDQIDLSQIKAIDLNFVLDSYNKSCTLLEMALKNNPELLLSEATKAVEKFERIAESQVTVAEIKNLLAEVEVVDIAMLKVEGIAELAEGVQLLKARVDAAKVKLAANIKATVRAQYESFTNTVNNVGDSNDILEAIRIKNALTTEYASYFEEAEWQAILAAKDEALVKLNELLVWEKEGWIAAEKDLYVVEKDGMFDVLHLGGALIYEKEKLNAKNFDLKLDVSKLSTNTGSWLSFGLMTEPAIFKNVETIEVTENRGILFLITAIDDTYANVQMYMITYMSSGFLTSLVGSIKVDITKELNVKFKEVSEEVAGLTANYFSVSFNDVTFAEKININQVDVSLDDAEGYLYIATSGASLANPTTYALKEVNGCKLDAESLKKAPVLTPPTSTDGAKEFTLGTTAQVSYQINLYGKKIVSVKVGDTVLTSTQYASRTTTLIIQNSFLKTLKEGKYDVVVATEDGECKLELVVVAEKAPEPTPAEKTGCFGSVAVSTILSITTLCSCLVILLNKKH